MHEPIIAQHEIGVKAGIGVSRISSIQASYIKKVPQKHYYMPSGQAGVFYSYSFQNKFSIGTELLFQQMEGKEKELIPNTDNNGNLTGLYTTITRWDHISCLGVPFYIGFDLGQITVNLGIQRNFSMYKNEREITVLADGATLFDTKYCQARIENNGWGVRWGMLYSISNKLRVEANYLYNKDIVYRGGYQVLIAPRYSSVRLQQITLGLRCQIKHK